MRVFKTAILLLNVLAVFKISLCEGNKEKTNNADSSITKFMKFLQVIPDVITNGPKDFLSVTYDSGVFADKGVELKPAQVKNQPKVSWKPESGAYYTLLMTDPDAPSRLEPSKREWQHWLIGNIPGNDVTKGDVLTEYVGAGPPEGTGLHRYVLLLFKQSKKIEFDEVRLSKSTSKGRASFSTEKFIKKYQLNAPIAGNFFQAQYDNYVPELYKQFLD